MHRDLFDRWASVGVLTNGKVDPYEDPEKVIQDTLLNMESDGRLLEFITSWISKYGHLIITKKLKFSTTKSRRLFSAIVEASQTTESKLIKMIQKPTQKAPEFLFTNAVPILKEVAKKNPDPVFLKQGFIVKKHNLLRPNIIMLPKGVFQVNQILRNRAIYGCTLRSDVALRLPTIGNISVRRLANMINVSPQTLQPIIKVYVQSGLVEWSRKGRSSQIQWLGTDRSNVA